LEASISINASVAASLAGVCERDGKTTARQRQLKKESRPIVTGIFQPPRIIGKHGHTVSLCAIEVIIQEERQKQAQFGRTTVGEAG